MKFRTTIKGLLAALVLLCLNAGAFSQDVIQLTTRDTVIVPDQHLPDAMHVAISAADSGWVPTSITADIRALVMLPSGRIIAGGDSGRVFLSNDNGANWTPRILGTSSRITSIAFSDNTVFAGTQGSGVFRSTDGGQSWTFFSTGLTNSYILSLLAASDGYLYAGTDASPGMFRSPTGHSDWEIYNRGLTSPFVVTQIVTSNGDHIIGTLGTFGRVTEGLYKRAKGDSVWQSIGDLPQGGSRFVYSLIVGPDGRTHYAGTFFGVHASTDGGDHWTMVTSLPRSRTFTIASGGENLFASMERGGIFRSQDYGASWQRFSADPDSAQVFGFSKDLKWGFVGTSSGLYRKGFPKIPWPFIRPYRMYVDVPTSPGTFGFSVVLGNEGGAEDTVSAVTVKNTNPSELKFAQFSNQPVPIGSREVALRYTITLTRESVPGVDTVWAQVTTQGLMPESPFTFMVIITKRPTTAVDESGNGVPIVYALEQNYPNPFNPTTQIAFTLPVSSRVRLVIYNTLGQHIRTLVNGNLADGRHAVQWDGRDDAGMSVPSGYYLYRIEAGNFAATRKMSLLK